MKQVAEMLGVELGEEFNIKGYFENFRFKLTEEGSGYLYNGKWISMSFILYDLLNGKLKLVKISKPILDEKEKDYLSAVIRPFRDRVESIYKYRDIHKSYESIIIRIKNDSSIVLPQFKKGTMYKRMKLDKKYTLEELGL